MKSLDISDEDTNRNIISKEGERSDLSSNNSSIRSPSLGKNEKLEKDHEELLIQQLAKILVDIFSEMDHGNKKSCNLL